MPLPSTFSFVTTPDTRFQQSQVDTLPLRATLFDPKYRICGTFGAKMNFGGE